MDEPRSPEQRKADALVMLGETHADLWLASASPDGRPHLVPLSFAWDGINVIVATESGSATARNVAASGRARLALGSTRDVAMVDAALVDQVPVGDAPTELADRYADQADWDPRSVGGEFVYLVLRPDRIQVWREENEIVGRTVMRAGEWLP